MRVLILTQYYEPEPAFKFADLARGLVARGHSVQVITGFPCYPHGKTYDGYRQTLRYEEVCDGVHVTRIPQWPDHSRSTLRRMLYYFSFMLSAAIIGLLSARKADVLLVYQSAMPTGLAAWWISRLRRIPYVLDVVDLWPEAVSASGMLQNRFAKWAISRAMRFIYRGASAVNVITEGYRKNLLALGVAGAKLSVIHCWPTKGRFDPVPRDKTFGKANGLHERFSIVYAGAIGPAQNLRTLLDAAELLRDLSEVQFLVIGDGLELAELVEKSKALGQQNVRFLGRRSPEEVQQWYAWADVLLVHLKPNAMSCVSIPSKTFAYMASGRPLIMAVEGEAAELVEGHGCGITTTPSDPSELAEAIQRLSKQPEAERKAMGHAATRAYLANYCSDVQVAKFERLLQQIGSEITR